MTKTLTEQWRDGTLPEGWYYLKVKSELANYPVISECVINYSSLKPYSDFYEYDDSHVEEVLAPVPSYDEYKELLRHSELSRNLVYEVLVNQKEYNELLDKAKEYKRLQEQKQKVIALIKDGRFVEALQELEDK